MQIIAFNEHAGDSESSENELSICRFQEFFLLRTKHTVERLQAFIGKSCEDDHQARVSLIIFTYVFEQSYKGSHQRMLRQALMEQRKEEFRRQSSNSASNLPVFEHFDQHFHYLRNSFMQKRDFYDSFTHFRLFKEGKLLGSEL